MRTELCAGVVDSGRDSGLNVSVLSSQNGEASWAPTGAPMNCGTAGAPSCRLVGAPHSPALPQWRWARWGALIVDAGPQGPARPRKAPQGPQGPARGPMKKDPVRPGRALGSLGPSSGPPFGPARTQCSMMPGSRWHAKSSIATFAPTPTRPGPVGAHAGHARRVRGCRARGPINRPGRTRSRSNSAIAFFSMRAWHLRRTIAVPTPRSTWAAGPDRAAVPLIARSIAARAIDIFFFFFRKENTFLLKST